MKYLILLLSVVTYVSSNKYCDIESCLKKGRQHTMCINTPENKCKILISTGLTQDEKDRILNKHNELRQRVARGEETRGKPGPQPAAVNMPNLVWDDEIAAFAQRTADICLRTLGDSCRDTEKEIINQSLAYNETRGDIYSIKVEDMVQDWYDHVEIFDGNLVDKPYETGIGYTYDYIAQYTQIVWAKTNKIGCGVVRFSFRRWYDMYNGITLLCNYGPAGNVIGEKIYEIDSNSQ